MPLQALVVKDHPQQYYLHAQSWRPLRKQTFSIFFLLAIFFTRNRFLGPISPGGAEDKQQLNSLQSWAIVYASKRRGRRGEVKNEFRTCGELFLRRKHPPLHHQPLQSQNNSDVFFFYATFFCLFWTQRRSKTSKWEHFGTCGAFFWGEGVLLYITSLLKSIATSSSFLPLFLVFIWPQRMTKMT